MLQTCPNIRLVLEHRHGTPRGNGFRSVTATRGEVTFDIRRGGSRCVKETPCAWQLPPLGVPNLPPHVVVYRL